MFFWFLRWWKRSVPPLLKIGGYKNYLCIIHTTPNDKIPKFLSFWIFPLPMHSVDEDRSKSKYYYCPFKVFFCSVTTLDDLCLAINIARNFSYLRIMFLRGQNYVNLCWNQAINLNVKVTPKRKFENLLHGLPP